MTVPDSDVDTAVLAVAKPSWRKVALVAGQAAHHIGGDFVAREGAYDLVARRIRTLVADGHLMARGDLTMWRHSEIRIALRSGEWMP